MDQQFVTATPLIDDDSERPTIPSLRPRQRPKIRKRAEAAVPKRHVFDAHAEHFFSNAETVPALVPDARYLAQLAALDDAEQDDTAWWLAQRRSRNLRLVMMLCTACVALLFAGVLR